MGKLRHSEPDYDLGTLALNSHYSMSQQSQVGRSAILLRGFLWSPRSTLVFASAKKWFLGEAK